MNAIPRNFFIYLILGLSPGVRAQTITLSGGVKSAAGAPLESALVRIEGTHSSALSNGLGQFSLVVPDSSWNATVTISAHLMGYATFRVPVIVSDSSLHQDFELESCRVSSWNPGDPPERTAPLPSRARLAHASGITDLREGTRSPGRREIRVWLWNNDAENPFDLYRFVDGGGIKISEHISSTWGAHRCRHDASGKTLCGQPSTSGTIPDIDDLYICRRLASGQEDRSTLSTSLESNEATKLLQQRGRYTAKDAGRNPHFMTIESWDGKEYRSGSYELQAGADSVARTDAQRFVTLLARIP